MKITAPKITKGDWNKQPMHQQDFTLIYSDAVMNESLPLPCVARLPWPGYTESNELEANASLICAAPRLADALLTIYANAGESPEWIRTRIQSALESAGFSFEQ